MEVMVHADPLDWMETPTVDTTAPGYDPDARAHVRRIDGAVLEGFGTDWAIESLAHGTWQ